jgi:hypothetical protein
MLHLKISTPARPHNAQAPVTLPIGTILFFDAMDKDFFSWARGSNF